MYNFIQQNYIEVERGVEYIKNQREAAILVGFWQKKTAEKTKNEEINRKKSQKNN